MTFVDIHPAPQSYYGTPSSMRKISHPQKTFFQTPEMTLNYQEFADENAHSRWISPHPAQNTLYNEYIVGLGERIKEPQSEIQFVVRKDVSRFDEFYELITHEIPQKYDHLREPDDWQLPDADWPELFSMMIELKKCENNHFNDFAYKFNGKIVSGPIYELIVRWAPEPQYGPYTVNCPHAVDLTNYLKRLKWFINVPPLRLSEIVEDDVECINLYYWYIEWTADLVVRAVSHNMNYFVNQARFVEIMRTSDHIVRIASRERNMWYSHIRNLGSDRISPEIIQSVMKMLATIGFVIGDYCKRIQ